MKTLSIKKLSRGFTLIELLVVIAILGVLAAALLAAIDPLEQIRKSQDSNYKDTSVEFSDAITRYYATKNALPWDTVANGGDGCTYTTGTFQTLNNMTGAAPGGCIQDLINQGELKPGFVNVTYLSKLKMRNPNPNAGPTDTETCFQPVSKSQIADPNTKYDPTSGAVSATCKSQGGAAVNCLWCTQ